MKAFVEQNYPLKVLLYIRLSDSLLRLKTDQGEYLLHLVSNDQLNTIFAHLAVTEQTQLLMPLVNNEGSYLSKREEQYFYLTPYLDDQALLARPVRIKLYLSLLSQLHRDFAYSIPISTGFFETNYQEIYDQLEQVAAVLDQEMSTIEVLDYPSPAQWLLLLNNQQFYAALRRARHHLERLKELTKDATSIRLTLTYQNFDYQHVNLKHKVLTDSSKLAFAPPLYDLLQVFSASYQQAIDFSALQKSYLETFPLTQVEIHWLLALLLIPKVDFSGTLETEKIVRLTKTLYHIRAGQEFERLISASSKESPESKR